MANVNLGNPVLMDAYVKQWHGVMTGNEVEAGVKGLVECLYNNQQALRGAVQNLTTEELAMNPQLMAASAEVRIAFHRTRNSSGGVGDGAAMSVPWWQWKAHENRGNVADGVLILPDGGKPLLVATREQECKWSPLNTEISGLTYHKDMNEVLRDMDGEGNCALAMNEKYGVLGPVEDVWDQYALGYCAEYGEGSLQPERSENGMLEKPVWWLPSMGELNLMLKYRYAINICMAQINGAMPLADEQYYWSSSLRTKDYAWVTELQSGFKFYTFKNAPASWALANAGTAHYVARPVTALEAGVIDPTNLNNGL